MGNLSDWLMGKHAGETQVKKFLLNLNMYSWSFFNFDEFLRDFGELKLFVTCIIIEIQN